MGELTGPSLVPGTAGLEAILYKARSQPDREGPAVRGIPFAQPASGSRKHSQRDSNLPFLR